MVGRARGILASVTHALAGLVGAGSGTRTTGHPAPAATVAVTPPAADRLVLTYDPRADGDPDAGEVVWAWVPFEENDGRGKDRPVLIIARHGRDRVYGVRLTSKSHDGDRDFLEVGTGAWDAQRRQSWADVDQVYSLHRTAMRREGSAMPEETFSRVAAALRQRFGWRIGE